MRVELVHPKAENKFMGKRIPRDIQGHVKIEWKTANQVEKYIGHLTDYQKERGMVYVRMDDGRWSDVKLCDWSPTHTRKCKEYWREERSKKGATRDAR